MLWGHNAEPIEKRSGRLVQPGAHRIGASERSAEVFIVSELEQEGEARRLRLLSCCELVEECGRDSHDGSVIEVLGDL
ncbi:hypothetical protein P9139_06535 [Curtobacterium flaccumfaciens]|nr:hypothetical protein P9139_06535 [Curtobacterium flaccumfaciens]